MIKSPIFFSRAEIEMALDIVNYVVYNSSIDAKSDADGIYLEAQNFIKYISAEDIPTLIKMLQKKRLYEDLDGKILDAITEK